MGLSRPSGATTLGLTLLLVLIGVAAGARRIAPEDPFRITTETLQAPDTAHFFGTDDLGRDVFAGVIHGTAISLAVGFAAATLSAVIGIAIGGIAGISQRADLVLMRITEFAQAMPRFFLIITLVSLFGGVSSDPIQPAQLQAESLVALDIGLHRVVVGARRDRVTLDLEMTCIRAD